MCLEPTVQNNGYYPWQHRFGEVADLKAYLLDAWVRIPLMALKVCVIGAECLIEHFSVSKCRYSNCVNFWINSPEGSSAYLAWF